MEGKMCYNLGCMRVLVKRVFNSYNFIFCRQKLDPFQIQIKLLLLIM